MKNLCFRRNATDMLAAFATSASVFIVLSFLPPVSDPILHARDTSQHAMQTAPVRTDGILDLLHPDGSKIISILIEIAQTPEEKARGLMERTLPDYSAGMLFVYDSSAEREFWMRNTPGSLDIMFITEQGCILTIARHTAPESDTRYHSAGPVRYVLEVRAGFCETFGITEGMFIRWRRT